MLQTIPFGTALLLLASLLTVIVQAAPSSLPKCQDFDFSSQSLEGTTTRWTLRSSYSPNAKDVMVNYNHNVTVPVYQKSGQGIIYGEFLEVNVHMMNKRIQIQTIIKDNHRIVMDKNAPLMVRINNANPSKSIWPQGFDIPIDPEGTHPMECEATTRFDLIDVSQESVSLSRVCPKGGC